MPNKIPEIIWPQGKRFAFTIVDDTDQSTFERVKPVYDFFLENNFLTTKTVWPLRAIGKPRTGGQSLEDPDYKNWILDLKAKGFEIALHGVSDGPATSERVIKGLDLFREIIGHDPHVHVNHVGQTEGIYWGDARFDGIVKLIYQQACRHRNGKEPSRYFGHDKQTSYFWGDLCRQRVTFVRNFTFQDINTIKMDPLMPYHDSKRPYVKWWFSSSEGSGIKSFCHLLSESNQDRLLEEGGACIVYTHLGSQIYKMPPEFIRLMRRLASLPGWFVPASTLLTYVGEKRGWQNVDNNRRVFRNMQWKWLLQKLGGRN